MTALQKLQFQSQAIRNFRRKVKRLDLDPAEAVRAAEMADGLETKVRARWSVRFGTFLRQVDGRG